MEKEQLYTALYPEFAPKLEKIGLSYDDTFNSAYSVASGKPNMEDLVRNALSNILTEYASTSPKTNTGKILRWLSRVFVAIMPFIKVKKK